MLKDKDRVNVEDINLRKVVRSFIFVWRVFIVLSAVIVLNLIVVFNQTEYPTVAKVVVSVWFVLWILYQAVVIRIVFDGTRRGGNNGNGDE